MKEKCCRVHLSLQEAECSGHGFPGGVAAVSEAKPMKRRSIRRKRTEITVETRRLLVVHRSKQQQWCSECAQLVTMLTPEDAATVSGVSSRSIYRWVEAERVHFSESIDGALARLASDKIVIKPWPLIRRLIS